jgi:ParB family chromosome partitioning protein
LTSIEAVLRQEEEGCAGLRDGLKAEREALGARRGVIPVANAVSKITLSSSRDIPFNKLVLSQSNVRRVKAGVSIEELAEDIARRTLLQSLSVRPVLNADGQETGMFEVPAGGRRYRALKLAARAGCRSLCPDEGDLPLAEPQFPHRNLTAPHQSVTAA